MSKTDFADYKYTIKEGQPSQDGKDDAPIWLMCEPMENELEIVGDHGFLGIHLNRDIKMDEAREIARLLNSKVMGISHTKLT